MNVNDRIALELGRAMLGKTVAEAQLEQANERISALTAELEAAKNPPPDEEPPATS